MFTPEFSPEVWEDLYWRHVGINRVPYTEVLTPLVKHFGEECAGKTLLEIGCGVGNNLLFAAWALGFEASGIDLSDTAISIAEARFSNLGIPYQRLEVMDAQDLEFEDGCFDAVIDRAALQHNSFARAERIVSQVVRVLKRGGCFVSTATSQDHRLFGKGTYLGNGAFLNEGGEGVRQFFSNHQIHELFARDLTLVDWKKVSTVDVRSGTLFSTIHHLTCLKE